jgi:hypothetical protein
MSDQPPSGGLPPVDLSQALGPPTTRSVKRAAGLANLVRNQPRPTPESQPAGPPSAEPEPPAPTEESMPDDQTPHSAPADAERLGTQPQRTDLDVAHEDPPAEPPIDDRPGTPDLASRLKQPTTIYVSSRLQQRFDRYRRAARGRTNTSVTLEAITAMRDQLRETVQASRMTPSPGGLFPSDPTKVTYAGAGPVQIQISLTIAQRQVLDQLTKDLGFERRATWIAPILNAYLPGRKEGHRA